MFQYSLICRKNTESRSPYVKKRSIGKVILL